MNTSSRSGNPIAALADELKADNGRHTVIITESESDATAFERAGISCLCVNPQYNAQGQLLSMLRNENMTRKTIIVFPLAENEREWAETIRKIEQVTTAEIKILPNREMKAAKIISGDSTNGHYPGALKVLERYAKEEEKKANPKPGNVLEYLNGNEFAADMEKFKQGAGTQTRFPILDQKINGGLHSGLFVIGAAPGTGKTTFVLQLADQIAEQHKHILFFSMEQSRLELVTKSICRISRKNNPSNQTNLKTSLQIRKGYTSAETNQAFEEYKEKIAPYINIIEGNFNTTTDTIRTTARNYIKRNKERPVVIIDYLQIIRPEEKDSRKDMRLQIDGALTAFKQISRDLNIPVILVSSLSRGNYYKSLSMDSFKESGGIEFTADVLIGLELEAVRNFKKETDEERREILRREKDKPVRSVLLTILKNRYGISDCDIKYEYISASDYFLEKNEYKRVKRTAL